MVGHAEAASDDRGVGHLVGEPDSRRKQLLAVANVVVLRNAASATDQRLVRIRIVGLDAETAGPPAVRVQLPSQAEIERQLRGRAPAVAGIKRVLILEAVHLDELAALARYVGRTEHE